MGLPTTNSFEPAYALAGALIPNLSPLRKLVKLITNPVLGNIDLAAVSEA